MFNGVKNYKDDNCEQCIHKDICKIRDEFLHHVLEIRKIADPQLNRFGINITCNYFKIEQPVQRGQLRETLGDPNIVR